jgi:hypothetical protein
MTRTRRAVSVILAGALFCFGVALLVIYFAPGDGSIARTGFYFWAASCASVWARYGHIVSYWGKTDKALRACGVRGVLSGVRSVRPVSG